MARDRKVRHSSIAEPPAERRRPVVLTVSPGAGFTYETSRLMGQLAADCSLIFLTTIYGGTPGLDALPPGEWFAAPSFPVFTAPSWRDSLIVAAMTFLITVRVLITRKVDMVLVVGSPHAAPMLLAARLFGRRTAFVESVTRVQQLSNTGKLIQRFRLATDLFVQWPGLLARAPGARLGTIL